MLAVSVTFLAMGDTAEAKDNGKAIAGQSAKKKTPPKQTTTDAKINAGGVNPLTIARDRN